MDEELKSELRKVLGFSKNSLEKSKKKYCLGKQISKSDCDGKIISAHTVSRKYLKNIADDGQVYSFQLDFNDIEQGAKHNLKMIGINRASCFTGFCAKHDNDLFSYLEDNDIMVDNKTAFLLYFRSISLEYYKKISVLNQQKEVLSEHPELSWLLKAFTEGLNHGISDLKKYYKSCIDIINRRSYDDCSALFVELNNVPPIMCSYCIAPTYDHDGNLLQVLSDVEDEVPEYLSVTSLSDGNKSYIVYSWLETDIIPRKYADSIKRSDSNIENAILSTMFDNAENIYIRPSWWNGLGEDARDHYISRFNNNYPIGEEDERLKILEGHLETSDFEITKFHVV